MRPIQKTTYVESAVANGVALTQTPVNTTDLTIAGSYATAGVATYPFATYVTFTSTSNLSTVTFTVTGTNSAGQVVTSAIVGPNNTTVTGVVQFKTITKIAVATVTTFSTEKVVVGGAAVGVGNGDWWPMDIYNPNQVTTISCNIVGSGSVTYSVEYTNEDPFDTSITQLAVAHPTAALTGASTDQTAFTTTLMRAVRVNVASGSAGTLRTTVVQQSTV